MKIQRVEFNWGYTIEGGYFAQEYTVGVTYDKEEDYPRGEVEKISETLSEERGKYYKVIFKEGSVVEVYNINRVIKFD